MVLIMPRGTDNVMCRTDNVTCHTQDLTRGIIFFKKLKKKS